MQHINEHTKIIARLHPQLNNRGLQIYNPYFAAKAVNAVYLLFQDPSLEKLLSGMRNLNLAGAIPAGFEHDPTLAASMDELGPTAKRIGRVSAIVQRGGKLIGEYNGGYGLTAAIKTVTPITGKRLVIMGAGTVVKGLLTHLELQGEYPAHVAVYNRTLAHAEALAKDYKIDQVGSLNDLLTQAEGDIFVNATSVGTPWNNGEDVVFPKELLQRFRAVADTTFVPLRPPLIATAEQAGTKTAPGWLMFVHQGAKTIGDILGQPLDIPTLSKLATTDFEKNWS
ncbi:MAG TPA: hypothetical protein VLF69_05310 [Candidatus Saccharimonadales bacterium]|nr:hypothetical protein [Candidatus Saccharimonadales bacterium]